jgi:hypothetical protein
VWSINGRGFTHDSTFAHHGKRQGQRSAAPDESLPFCKTAAPRVYERKHIGVDGERAGRDVCCLQDEASFRAARNASSS